MKNILITILGGLAFAALCWLAITYRAPVIEMRIADDASEVLADDRFTDVDVRADGRTITLLGRVPTGDARAHAERSVRNLPSVKRVINRLELHAPETPDIRQLAPYRLSLSLSASQARLTGLVASENARMRLREIAEEQYGEQGVVQDLVVDEFARDQWREAAEEILTALFELSEAEAELTDSQAIIHGRAPTPAANERAAAAIRAAIPYGVALQYNVSVHGG